MLREAHDEWIFWFESGNREASVHFRSLDCVRGNAIAQSTSGALLGSHPADSAVARSAITVTYKDTGAARTGASGSGGTFGFADLLPGTYSLCCPLLSDT
jgi:hypothetical protein